MGDCPKCIHGIMLQCWCYNPNERPTFHSIFNNLCTLMLKPCLLSSDNQTCQTDSLTSPFLDSTTSPNILDTSALENWLDSKHLGGYKEHFYANGITDLESLTNVDTRDLQRLGVISSDDTTRFERYLSTLRHQQTDPSPHGAKTQRSSSTRLSVKQNSDSGSNSTASSFRYSRRKKSRHSR